MVLTYWEMVIRLIIGAILGGVVGYERERADKPAGLRTHILVCLASTLIMLLSIHVSALYPEERFDPGRIAAQVISGMGFLGAGTIIRQGNIVRGLTTAASLWFVAGLGLAIGAGFYFPSLISVLIVLILFFVRFDKLLRIRPHLAIEISHRGDAGTVREIVEKLHSMNYDISEISSERLFGGRNVVEVRLTHVASKAETKDIISTLSAIEKVDGVTLQE